MGSHYTIDQALVRCRRWWPTVVADGGGRRWWWWSMVVVPVLRRIMVDTQSYFFALLRRSTVRITRLKFGKNLKKKFKVIRTTVRLNLIFLTCKNYWNVIIRTDGLTDGAAFTQTSLANFVYLTLSPKLSKVTLKRVSIYFAENN